MKLKCLWTVFTKGETNKFKVSKRVSGDLCSTFDMTHVALGLGRFWSCPSNHKESWGLSPAHEGGGSPLLVCLHVLAWCEVPYKTWTLAACRDMNVLQFLAVIYHGIGWTWGLRENLGFTNFGLNTENSFYISNVERAYSMLFSLYTDCWELFGCVRH